MVRKITALVLALLLIAGCAMAEGDLLAQIKEKGEITIATEGMWMPWTFHDENDNLVGYDVEVAAAIAERIGVKAKFIECEWDGIFAGLETGRYDIAANGIEITPNRALKYNFSVPYCYIRTALIVRDDNDDIKCFEDLAGKKTANSISSTYMLLAESYGAETMGVDTLDQTLTMVLSGRVDATLNAEVSFFDYMTVHPDAPLKVVALTEEASHVAIPVRMGPENESLYEAINEAIEELSAEGELTRLSIKYFGKDIASAELTK